MKINERIVEFLKDKETNIKELSEFLKLDSSMIHAWKISKYCPSTENVIKLCEYFNCSIDYMLNQTEDIGNCKAKFVSSFKERMKLLMKEKNKSTYQITIKDKLFSSSCFDKWFKKNVIPSPETLVKLSDYFKVTIEYLLGRE